MEIMINILSTILDKKIKIVKETPENKIFITDEFLICTEKHVIEMFCNL